MANDPKAGKIVIITQARMGSTRLPGKILKRICGKTLLEHQIERLRRSRLASEIVVATTDQKDDQAVADLCGALNVPIFRGSEMDVLARYAGAASAHSADIVVRVTSDCPLIDPSVVDLVIQKFLHSQGEVDYASNVLERTYPRGLDTEVFSQAALMRAFREANLQSDREHVTPYLHRHCRLAHVTDARDLSDLRWTVDTPADFELVSRIISALYPQNPSFTTQDVLDLLDRHPDWNSINRHISQKKI